MNLSEQNSVTSAVEPLPLGWWRQTCYVLAVGFVFFFFSERLFWTVFGVDATLPELIITWLAYSAVAYLFLSICWSFRVSGFAAIFLSGALFGWLLEGGIAPTLYGTEASAPFPLSLIWTSVAWHATLTVWLGWHRLGVALREGRGWEVAGLSLFFGVFWGMWGMYPWQETPPIETTEDVFLFHAVLMTLLVAVSYLSINRLQRLRHFQPGPLGILMALAIWGVFWLQYAIALGLIVPVILGSVLLAVMIPLWRTRNSRSMEPVLAAHRQRTRWLPYALLLFMLPTTATITYVVGVNTGLTQFPISYIVLGLSTAMGLILLLIAYVKVCLMTTQTIPANTQTTTAPSGVRNKSL